MKKVLLIVLALLICIPAVVAIVSYRMTKSASPDAASVSSMVLTSPDGTSVTFTDEGGKDSDGVKMIELFVSLMKDASEVSGLPMQLSGQHYKVSMSSKEDAYQFYFTENPEVCYYTNATRVFKLKAEKARQFLNTPYAACLYTASALPVLLLSGQTAQPTAASWYYKTYDGSFLELDPASLLAKEPPRFSLEGGLGLTFSTEPATCTLKIVKQNDSSTLYDGAYDLMPAGVDLGSAGTVSVTVNASWAQAEDTSSYGSVSYTFFANITSPAEFYLMASPNNQAGDVVTLTAYNVTDPSRIQFSSDPDLGFTPQFFAVSGQNYAVALVPLPISMAAGTCTMTLTYGGISSSLEMKVAARSLKSSNLVVSNAIYNSYYTEAARAAYQAEIQPYLSYSSPAQLWSGDFTKTFADTAIKSGYGKNRTIYIASKATQDQFVQETIVYKAASGTAIPAAAAGEVIFAGYLDFCGNIVIIEHGYGLKTWYMHLDTYTVHSGQTVAKGESIGTAGKTGFFTSEYTGVEFGMSVFDCFICPYDLWSDGELKGLTFRTK